MHLSDGALLRDLASLVAQDRKTTAFLLAHLAEVDERKLYLPQGYSSMHAYCTEALRFSEETASRIRAARAARRFPAILAMVAEGRLHLSAVVMLHPYLSPENAADLLAAAAHATKAELEMLLAERFPRLEFCSGLTAIPPTSSVVPEATEVANILPSPGTVDVRRPPVARIEAVAPERFAFQVTIDQQTRDLLQRAQELLGHRVPNRDLETVLARVVELGVAELEKRKFATTDRPRTARPAMNVRRIPAQVRRAVVARDQGRCTFVGEQGHRCESRERLEFDHIVPVARGGRSTASNIRLRCRPHNQYEADCAFGREFMDAKRRQAADQREGAKEQALEVIPYLKALKISDQDARRAAALCESIPNAPLEERVKRALSCFGRGTKKPAWSGARA